jgi:AcrR family transcriptional regulator
MTAANPVPPGPAAPRRGRPRDAQAERTILEAAVSILSEVGFNRLTIEAVAARAGVGKPTIYRRWPSKLELIIDAVQRLAPPFPTADTGDPLTDLRQIVPQLIADLTSSPVSRANVALACDAQTHAELARGLAERYLAPRRAAIADILRRGVATGQLRTDIDVEMAIDLMVGASVYRWLVTAQPVDADAARRVVDTVWESLRAPSR